MNRFVSGYVIFDKDLASGDERSRFLASSSNYHIIHANHAVAQQLINSNVMTPHKCVDIASASYR